MKAVLEFMINRLPTEYEQRVLDAFNEVLYNMASKHLPEEHWTISAEELQDVFEKVRYSLNHSKSDS